MRMLFRVLLIFFTLPVFAQDSTLLFSSRIDISANGWNKVVRLNNGNTLLFHFENKKKTRVLKYSSEGLLLSDNYDTYKLIDTNRLDECALESVFEMDGVLNLFIFQFADRRNYNLVHLQYDGEGRLLNETNIKKFGVQNNILYSEILYNEAYPGYCILHYSNGNDADSLSLTFAYYNTRHELTKTVLHKIISKKAYDVRLLGFKLAPDGAVYGAVKVKWQFKNINKVQSVLYLMHIPDGYNAAIAANYNLQEGEKVSGVLIDENTFSGTINFLLLEQADVPEKRNETDIVAISEQKTTLIVTNQYMQVERLTPLLFNLVNENTIKAFDGDRLKAEAKNKYVTDIFMDNNGVSTCLQFGVWAKDVMDGDKRLYWGNLYVTKYDDYGKELSGEVFPISRHVFVDDKRLLVMGNNLDDSYLGATTLFCKKNSYVIFNDNRDNFSKTIKEELRDVSDCRATDAVYYRINKKDGTSKRYLLGEPTEQEHKQVCTNAEYFDEKTGLLTGIARIVKGDKETYHVFWKRLD